MCRCAEDKCEDVQKINITFSDAFAAVQGLSGQKVLLCSAHGTCFQLLHIVISTKEEIIAYLSRRRVYFPNY